jgi:aldose 1-epimerase
MPQTTSRSTPAGEAHGVPVERWSLQSGDLTVEILTYGGIIAAIHAPDRDGKLANVALGRPDVAGYIARSAHFGAITGRYANRISGGRFSLDGVDYQLPQNSGTNALHSGPTGLDKQVWQAEAVEDGVALRHTSPDGTSGLPGEVELEVVYRLRGGTDLCIDYTATTTKPTILNLTNHGYFNLAGEAAGDIMGHELTIVADAFTPTDAIGVPSGEIRAVAGTVFDFREATPIGARIREADEQILCGKGYDHNWVLSKSATGALEMAARVREPGSGRTLEVWTTEPGVQFYSGNQLDGSIPGTSGPTYRQSAGFCLETQHFPDSPNRPNFPSTVLRPGETLRSTTIFRFGVA